jgi:hypothetical protein
MFYKFGNTLLYELKHSEEIERNHSSQRFLFMTCSWNVIILCFNL